MRRLERAAVGKPRFGRNERLADEIADLGQDPFLAFPDSDMTRGETGRDGLPALRVRFLGLFGPHGALPLTTTEEVERWVSRGDRAFVRFVDILVARFVQLYFRAWASGQPIVQFDRPDDDGFQAALRALVGAMTPAFRNRDGLPDTARLAAVALATGAVRSSARLRQILALFLPAEVEVEELVPTWLAFEPDDLSVLGGANGELGRDLRLGRGARSVGERIRIHLRVQSLEAYGDLLPGGVGHAVLRDLVDWYLGRAFEVEVALWLPSDAVHPLQLGKSDSRSGLGRLGLLGSLPTAGPDDFVRATLFDLLPDPLAPARPIPGTPRHVRDHH